ncbi:MAG: hypothetical protein EHM84_00675 [Lysobacterales bacterium]|nr:MAG: hypothetical protein EHM84_00675 [Xanthomonadales bacterium]
MTETTAICHFCHASCGIRITIQEGRVVHIIGDLTIRRVRATTAPRSSSHEFHSDPGRVLHPRSAIRMASCRTTSASALDGVAHRLQSILAKHGPRSVSIYSNVCSAGRDAARCVSSANFAKSILSTSLAGGGAEAIQ